MKFLFTFLFLGVTITTVMSLTPNTPPPQPPHHGHHEHGEAPPLNLEISPDGNFRYSFQTFDGISAQAQGVPKAIQGEEDAETITGTFSWTSPEGKLITVNYVADETGYHPQVAL